MAWPVLQQGRKMVKIVWCQIPTVRETVKRFPTEILQQVPSLLGRVRPGTGEPRHIAQGFQRGAVAVVVNCASMFAPDESQKTLANT